MLSPLRDSGYGLKSAAEFQFFPIDARPKGFKVFA